MYKIDLPTKAYSIDADVSQQKFDTQDKTVALTNYSPRPMSASAYSEVGEGGQTSKAKALFLDDIDTTNEDMQAALNNVFFDFASSSGGARFEINGKEDTPTAFARNLVGATSSINTDFISGVIVLDVDQDIWQTMMSATANLNAMRETDFARYSLLGITRDGMSVDWGDMANITWIVSITDSDTATWKDASTGVEGTGTKEYRF